MFKVFDLLGEMDADLVPEETLLQVGHDSEKVGGRMVNLEESRETGRMGGWKRRREGGSVKDEEFGCN